ncbi:MAG TPA: zinc-dependent metalloprotease [Pirellulales bacterium]|nr:zinc-dependent metalloprotease [Pirellulales bacterium]
MKRLHGLMAVAGVVWATSHAAALAQAPSPPEFPPFNDVVQGHEQVTSIKGPGPTMYTLYLRRKDNHLLAELPPDYTQRKYFIALTVASGESFAGLQQGDTYVYWKPYDRRLALIEPNIATRSTGDQESQSSVKRLFTDRVLLDTPIVTMSPRGGPVIDLGSVLIGQAAKFFGGAHQVSNPALTTIKTAKAFPQNVELGFEAPMLDGRLKILHYSISVIPENTGYQPRVADQRVGYFTTSYNELGKYQVDDTRVRYVNRWRLEKRDPSLKLSPPKNAIVFHIEQTTPVRYRPWVKRGILYWNKAFERIGIRDAIEVRQQDAVTGEHMEKDPEDVQYNFVRWLNNNVGTAIGPSRTHPLTGEILDADIILTDGWIRHYVHQHKDVLPSAAMEGFGPETLAWLDDHPRWDPRLLLAPPADRPRMLQERARRGARPEGGHPLANIGTTMLGDDEYDGLVGRHSQCNGLCMAAQCKALDVALFRMLRDISDLPAAGPQDGDQLDGMPEEFVGPLLAELVAHEVGHTLGLRHNFKASSVYSLADINNEKMKGKPLAGSVMDYLPINIDMKDGAIQGEYAMVDIGPYDLWAIEYGYTFEADLKPILARVAEPELRFATDEDTMGPDPLARRYDFSSNPLEYARSRMKLARLHRERMIEKFVKDGDSWAKARSGYEMTLKMQLDAVGNMADWLGGAFINRDKKGDKNGRPPVEVVPAAAQRDALKFVIENTFNDEAFGLTPDLLRHMTLDKWLDGDGFELFMQDATWPVHDRVMGIQGSTLTMLMNPTTLRLVYDNEVSTAADVDVLTLPELLETISTAIWSELDKPPAQGATARKPVISSLRRNLQREHLERLIDLTLPSAAFSAAHKPISNLALLRLRELKDRTAKALEQKGLLDPYTLAHLTEAQVRIDKALDAQYIYNTNDLRGPAIGFPFIFGQEPKQE